MLSTYLWRTCRVYAMLLLQSRGCSLAPVSASWTTKAQYSALLLSVMKMAWPQVLQGHTQQIEWGELGAVPCSYRSAYIFDCSISTVQNKLAMETEAVLIISAVLGTRIAVTINAERGLGPASLCPCGRLWHGISNPFAPILMKFLQGLFSF